MSAKKRQRAETGQTPYPGYDPRPFTEPRPEAVLLRPGTRRTAPPESMHPTVTLDALLGLWEMARQDRHRRKPRRERLGGLFGGNRS